MGDRGGAPAGRTHRGPRRYEDRREEDGNPDRTVQVVRHYAEFQEVQFRFWHIQLHTCALLHTYFTQYMSKPSAEKHVGAILKKGKIPEESDY